MTQEPTKPASASVTIWAGILTVAAALTPSILTHMGVSTPGEQQAAIDALSQLVAAVGGAIAVYGRLTATRRIG